VQVFWGLDKKLAQRKHFPSVNWNISFSKYIRILEPYFEKYDPDYSMLQQKMKEILQKEDDLQEIVQLVGKDSLSEDQKCTLEVAKIIREDFLQQNGFTDYDMLCPLAKTIGMMKVIVGFHDAAQKTMSEFSGEHKIGWNTIYSAMRDLIKKGLWNDEMKTQLIAHNGSVQYLDLPSDVKELYKTVWEIKQRNVLDMAADRGAYIDQSQSLNIHMVDATTAKLSSMHFHGWQLGLKTGMYYLRTKAAVDAIKFTVEVDKLRRSSTSSLPDSMKAPAGNATEKDAIERLKAGESKYSCVGCSA